MESTYNEEVCANTEVINKFKLPDDPDLDFTDDMVILGHDGLVSR